MSFLACSEGTTATANVVVTVDEALEELRDHDSQYNSRLAHDEQHLFIYEKVDHRTGPGSKR